MILNKKGLMVLPLAALLFSCGAKTISYDEAIKFAENNYTEKEAKTVTLIKDEIKGNAKDDASKEALKNLVKTEWGVELDDNLTYTEESKPAAAFPPIPVTTASVIKAQYSDPDVFSFSLKDKELSVIQTSEATIGSYKVTTKITMVCNNEGYQYKGIFENSYSDSKISCGYNYTQTYTF